MLEYFKQVSWDSNCDASWHNTEFESTWQIHRALTIGCSHLTQRHPDISRLLDRAARVDIATTIGDCAHSLTELMGNHSLARRPDLFVRKCLSFALLDRDSSRNFLNRLEHTLENYHCVVHTRYMPVMRQVLQWSPSIQRHVRVQWILKGFHSVSLDGYYRLWVLNTSRVSTGRGVYMT